MLCTSLRRVIRPSLRANFASLTETAHKDATASYNAFRATYLEKQRAINEKM